MTPDEEWRKAASVSPFALLVEPSLALQASERLTKLGLPSCTSRLDGRKSRVISPELSDFDEEIDAD